jgi:hypothetical protein
MDVMKTGAGKSFQTPGRTLSKSSNPVIVPESGAGAAKKIDSTRVEIRLDDA